jgi:hypothetical protein
VEGFKLGAERFVPQRRATEGVSAAALVRAEFLEVREDFAEAAKGADSTTVGSWSA